jgi:hypothetical protein
MVLVKRFDLLTNSPGEDVSCVLYVSEPECMNKKNVEQDNKDSPRGNDPLPPVHPPTVLVVGVSNSTTSWGTTQQDVCSDVSNNYRMCT